MIMLSRESITMFDSLKNSEDQTKSILNSIILAKGEKQPESANYPLLLMSTSSLQLTK